MIVSLTIVRYRKLFVPLALIAMALHRLPLMLQKGCTFWKLLGSGRGGTFSLNPDWQQWGLLATWKSEKDFEAFYEGSFISKWWNFFAKEQWTVLLQPIQSHGKWKENEPFVVDAMVDYNGLVAVLTRATIRVNRLKNFWANVEEVSDIMKQSDGYIMSIGIGEAPVYRQATFSVWENIDSVKAFAYNGQHAEVIKKTRSEQWYSEELFARFKPLKTMGTLNGFDPLAGKI